MRGKGYFVRFVKNENNTPNLRRALIFNSQKCDMKVGIKCEITRKHKLTDIAKRQLLITAALPFARQKLQDYFEGYSEFHLKIDVYISNEFSGNPSTYSA